MKVLVTGASGFVGRNLIPALLKNNHQVVAWKGRETSVLGIENPAMTVHWGDLGDPAVFPKLEKALSGCDAVIHMAAKTSQAPSSQEKSSSVNIEGTRKLLELSKKCGVRKFVFVSSQSAKISNPGNYGASKKKGEDLVLESGLDSVILRPSLIYGSGEAGIFKKFVMIVDKLPVIPIPYTSVKFQPVFVGDVVKSILKALESSRFSVRLYDVAGQDPVTFPGLIRKVAQAKGYTRILIPVPMPLAILGAKILSLLMKKPPVTVDNLIGLTEETPLELGPLFQDLKIQPLSLEEGLKNSFAS